MFQSGTAESTLLEQESWESRISIYRLLGFLFYTKPGVQDLEALRKNDVILSLLNLDLEDEIPGLTQLKDALAQLESYEHYYSQLRCDYQFLFEGPGKLLAPPWESVYLSAEKLIFEEQTMAVRQFYKHYNLQIANFGKEPDDHMGLELQFMAFLAEQSWQLLTKNELSPFHSVISAQKDFLQEHLLQWASLFADQVCLNAETSFYKGWGLFLPWYLENDLAFLNSYVLTKTS